MSGYYPFGSSYSRAKELYERQMYERQQEQYYRDSLNQAVEVEKVAKQQEAQKQAANQSKTQKRRKEILLLIGA